MTISINTRLTFKNETDIRGRALLDLISFYIPEFSGHYYGFRSLGSHDITFPAVFVEPDGQSPKMITTAKWHIKWQFSIYWFFYNNSPEDIVSLTTSGQEALVKLFSNNALDDLQVSNPPSNKFKTYPGYWLTSEMKSVEISRTILNAIPNRSKYMRAGIMRLEVEDILLK
jgi:hypothetical protein